MTSPTVNTEAGGTNLFGTLVSAMQTNLSVGSGAITGTLHKLTSGQIVSDWGEGYFMALKLSNFDERATSVKVGLDPSQGSGLVEILTDPDKNGVFKVTNKDVQRFKVVTTDGMSRVNEYFDLSGLTLD